MIIMTTIIQVNPAVDELGEEVGPEEVDVEGPEITETVAAPLVMYIALLPGS